jgi:iron complex outermembrane receptor protein
MNKKLALFFISAGAVSVTVKADDEQPQQLETIVISTPLTQTVTSAARPVTVLNDDELRLKAASTIGETLKDEAGITSQSFGPGVGTPVIRGQSGPRVQVLQNSLGTNDASSLSPDHANSIEPFFADQVEVLRGPATLLYGSGAIGGIVNVIDNRIPEQVPERLIQGAVEQRYNSVFEGKTSAFKLEGGKDMFAWHLDGLFRESIPMQIPGLAIDESAEAATHTEDEHEEEIANSSGRLPNSNTRAKNGSAGFSIIGDKGLLGFSVNHLENNYGVPPGAHAHDHEEESHDDHDDHDDHEDDHQAEIPEAVRVDMRQTRYDIKGELIDPFAHADSLRMRLAYTDYQHVELENNSPSTRYENETFESRLEMMQKAWAVFDHGVIGMQTKNSTFSATGAEAIVPKSQIDSYGFFAVEDIHYDDWVYEFGLRGEHQTISPENRTARTHTPISGSVSALWNITDQESVSLAFSRAERAPDVQELFANGLHLATRNYEIGNADLREETAHNLDLGFHVDRNWIQADVNFYYNWANDYIAQIYDGTFFDRDADAFVNACPAGDCTPVVRAQQRDAEFQGFEANFTFPLLETRYGKLDSTWFGDYVRGRFTDGTDVPRLPPLRYGTQLTWSDTDWQANIRLTRAERQNRPGENETETPDYWLLNTSANYRLGVAENTDLMLYVKGNNLLNQEIRNSVSFLRNFAPEAGRGFEVGLRVDF